VKTRFLERSNKEDKQKDLLCSCVGLFAVATGCNQGSNTNLSYKAAINDHFKAFPVCIWSQPKTAYHADRSCW
jgi:hypothetical protein